MYHIIGRGSLFLLGIIIYYVIPVMFFLCFILFCHDYLVELVGLGTSGNSVLYDWRGMIRMEV